MLKNPQRNQASLIRTLVSAALVASAVGVLAKNWSLVRQSVQAAQAANAWYLFLALLCTALTFILAASIYTLLAIHRLRYRNTLLVELSTAFVNRLLPAGLGGLGVHGAYLYKHRHSIADATAIVSVNNLLGMLAHFILLGAVVALYPSIFGRLAEHFQVEFNLWWAVVGILVVVSVGLVRRLRRNVVRFSRNMQVSISKIGLERAGVAIAVAMMLTTTYTTILYLCARSLEVPLGAVEVFVVFSIGMLFATASPTPGGLVGAEAGLLAGFVGYHVPPATAGAAVLLYRLATYWLPLLPGLLALGMARRRNLL